MTLTKPSKFALSKEEFAHLSGTKAAVIAAKKRLHAACDRREVKSVLVAKGESFATSTAVLDAPAIAGVPMTNPTAVSLAMKALRRPIKLELRRLYASCGSLIARAAEHRFDELIVEAANAEAEERDRNLRYGIASDAEPSRALVFVRQQVRIARDLHPRNCQPGAEAFDGLCELAGV